MNEGLKKQLYLSRWDVIAVIEEFCHIDTSYCNGVDPQLVPHSSSLWGTSYFFDSFNGHRIKNHYISAIADISRYAIAFVKNIDLLMPDSGVKTRSLNRGLGIIDTVLESGDEGF